MPCSPGRRRRPAWRREGAEDHGLSEMGHALVGDWLEHTNPIQKITIVSRGQALGLTISLPARIAT